MDHSPFANVRIAWAAALVVMLAGIASAAPPTLSRLQPPGGQRGSKVALTCVGSFGWPVKVWAPGVEVTVAKDSGKLELAIPADLAADRIWLRLHNAEGASAAVPFLVGSLPEISEQEPNNAPSQAQKLTQAGNNITAWVSKNCKA